MLASLLIAKHHGYEAEFVRFGSIAFLQKTGRRQAGHAPRINQKVKEQGKSNLENCSNLRYFTRSATETLKKRGINDACIVAASNPHAFTYCREGSLTLWKYQVLDLEQQAAIQNGQKLHSTDYGQITVAEVDSVACQPDNLVPFVKPAFIRGLALGLITLFLLIGLRYTYRAIMHCNDEHIALSDPRLRRLTDALPAHNPTVKALGAFGIAATVALVYFGYMGFERTACLAKTLQGMSFQ